MSIDQLPPAQPATLTVHPDGTLDGRTASYEKLLADMAGVYADEKTYRDLVDELGGDRVVYSVHSHLYREEPGALIVGTSTLLPGMIGEEFAVTRGHLHAIADRAELYHCLSGHGLLLLETVDGRSETVELRPGDATTVPGHWIHRSVNVGSEPFVTVFCYPADAGQDYGIISDAGGMSVRIVSDGAGGWTARANESHRGYGSGDRPAEPRRNA